MSGPVVLPPDPASASVARRFVREALDRWGLEALEEGSLLLVSELVTNAVLHARTAVEVSVSRVGDGVRIDVADGSPRLPVPRRYSSEAATGRGLVLVERVARRWGVEPVADGKVVWCEVDTASSLAPLADDAFALTELDLDDLDSLAGAFGDDTDATQLRRAWHGAA